MRTGAKRKPTRWSGASGSPTRTGSTRPRRFSAAADSKSNNNSPPCRGLGPHEIASRLDDTFVFDIEGEIRGMWKRPARMGT